MGLVVNTLAADENYLVLNRNDLTIPIQMELSEKEKKFDQCLAEFLKFIINFKYFGKKVEPYRFCISETTNLENIVR